MKNKDIVYSGDELNKIILTENTRRYAKVLNRLIECVEKEGLINYNYLDIYEQNFELFDLLEKTKLKDYETIFNMIEFFNILEKNEKYISKSLSFTVQINFVDFISILESLDGILDINTFLVIKGY